MHRGSDCRTAQKEIIFLKMLGSAERDILGKKVGHPPRLQNGYKNIQSVTIDLDRLRACRRACSDCQRRDILQAMQYTGKRKYNIVYY